MDAILNTMVEAAQAGGVLARERQRRGFDVSIKGDGSPVTDADRDAEAAIARVLAAAYPEHGWLGEETGVRGGTARRFIVDPIDGTRNFVKGLPQWATLVALEEDGVVTAGVVYQPVADQLHVARRGGGAYADGARIRVSAGGGRRGGAPLPRPLGRLLSSRRRHAVSARLRRLSLVHHGGRGQGRGGPEPRREALGPRRAAPPRGGGRGHLHRLRGRAHHLLAHRLRDQQASARRGARPLPRRHAMTRVTELDTPVVTIRLDIMEANIRRVQAMLDRRGGSH